jgi:hypothetical protein
LDQECVGIVDRTLPSASDIWDGVATKRVRAEKNLLIEHRSLAQRSAHHACDDVREHSLRRRLILLANADVRF